MIRAALAAIALAATAPALAQTPAPARTPTAEAPGASAPGLMAVQPGVARLSPYLEGHEPDTVAILPPPPKDGSLIEQADFAAFVATRKLAGTPRWDLAALDAVDYFHGFGCILGVTLTPEGAPKTVALLRRALGDAKAVTDVPKDRYQRRRPLYGNAQPICVESQREGLLKSASYPSGHATAGWTIGLILAEAAPDARDALLVRARAFGESRVVCGVHFPSDIEAGRTNGASLVAALHGDPAFRADLDAAREELKTLRGASPAPTGGQCAAETKLAATTPW